MKNFIQWAFIASICFLLIACSSRQTQKSQPLLGSSGKKTTVVVWLIEQDNEFYSRLAEEFERENPSIDISLQEIPEDEYIPRIDSVLGGSPGPDLALVKKSHWVVNGHFLPVDESIWQYSVPIQDFNQGAFSRDCEYNQHTYCLGTYTSAYVLLYNKDLFDRFGINYPKPAEPLSIDEFSNLAKRFQPTSTKDPEKIWGSDFPLPYLWLERRTHLSSDGREIDRFINDEPTINTYQRLSDLCTGEIALCSSFGNEHPQNNLDLFTQGKLATLITNLYSAIPAIEQSGFRWGAAVAPTETNAASRWTTAWTDGFGVLKTSSHPDEALKFLAFLGNRGSELRIKFSQPPLNMKLAPQWAGEDQARKQVVKVIETAGKDLFVPDYAGTTEPIEPAFQKSIEEGIPAKDVLNEIAPNLQKFLDQSWAEYDRVKKK